MVWEERVRRAAWISFALMWIPVAYLVYLAMIDAPEERIYPAIPIFLFFCMAFTLLLVGSFGIGWFERENIKKKGMPATATILSVSDTGWTFNDQPKLSICLDVRPLYEPRFLKTVEYVVPYAFLSQLKEGNKVRVLYIEGTDQVALADL
jgi:hypothetical protein